MKKIIALLLILGLLGGGGYYAYENFYKKSANTAMENLLPSGVLFYMHFADIDKNVAKLSATDMWKHWKTINFDRLMASGEIPLQQKESFQRLKKQLNSPETRNIYKKFLSKDVAIAVYPSNLDFTALQTMDQEKIVEEVFSNFIVITRIGKDIQAAEFLTRFVNNFGSNVTVRKVDYEGHIIQLIPIDEKGLELGFVRFNDLLVLGIGEGSAKKAIDVSQQKTPSLASDVNIQKAKDKILNPSGMYGFWDMQQYFRLIVKTMKDLTNTGTMPNAEEFNQQMADMERNMSGFGIMGISGNIDELSQIKMDMYYDSKLMQNPAMAEVYSNCKNGENATLKFIPKDTLAYSWSSCFSLKYQWDEIKQQMTRGNAGAEGFAKIEESLGMSIEDDIIPAIGDEIGGYLADIQTGGFFPLPKFGLFVKTADFNKAQKLLQQLTEMVPFVQAQKENYEGYDITYLASPMPDVQPSYAFFDKYVLITISRNMMKSSIDTFKGKSQSLTESESFKVVNKGLTDKTAGIGYVKMDQLFTRVESIVEWGNSWAGSQEQKKVAFQSGAEQRLTDTKNQIAILQNEIKELRDKAIVVEDEIWNLETKSMDTSLTKKTLASLKNDITYKEGELAAYEEQIPEMEMMLQSYTQKGSTQEVRRLFLDDVVYPFLKGLQGIKTIGAKTIAESDVFESSMFFKL